MKSKSHYIIKIRAERKLLKGASTPAERKKIKDRISAAEKALEKVLASK